MDHGFFLILDLAIGGGFPNGVCNCSSPSSATSSGAAMSVGYVAVYTDGRQRRRRRRRRRRGGGKSCTTTATSDISADCYSRQPGNGQQDDHHRHRPEPAWTGTRPPSWRTASTWSTANVNFGLPGSTQFDARVASGAAGGVSGLVEVVLDNPSNAPVGSFAVGNTGGWSTWKTIPANIRPRSPARTTSTWSSSPARAVIRRS